jgi:hypothetical protein
LDRVLIVDSPLNLVSYPFKSSVNRIFILIDESETIWVPFYKELIQKLFIHNQKIKVISYKKEDFFNGTKKFLQLGRILRQLTLFDVLRFITSELYLNWFTNPLGNWFKYKNNCYNLYHSYTDFDAIEYLLINSKLFAIYAKVCSLLNIKKIMYSLCPVKVRNYYKNAIRVEVITDRMKLKLQHQDTIAKKFIGHINLLYLFVHEEDYKYNQLTKNTENQKQWLLDLNCELIVEITKIIGKKDVNIIVKEHYKGYGRLLNGRDKDYLRNKLKVNGISLIFLNELFSNFEMFMPLELTYKHLNLTWVSGELSTFMLDESTTEIRKIVLLESLVQYRSKSYVNKVQNSVKLLDHEEIILL